jgi:tRNA A37 threonylcarbamoyladenosine dehydratase
MFQRLALLTGPAVIEALSAVRIIVFGLGGVGSWCAEALVRSGAGRIVLVDSDTVCVTNINRQIQAGPATVGRYKTEALRERLLGINPRCEAAAFGGVFSGETADSFGIAGADYCIDAIDSLTHKLDLIEYAAAAGMILASLVIRDLYARYAGGAEAGTGAGYGAGYGAKGGAKGGASCGGGAAEGEAAYG